MPDVNILVYAHREETAPHSRYAAWLTQVAAGDEPFGISELVLHGFLRVVTNARLFEPPSTMAQGLEFIDALLARDHCVLIRPGAKHWEIFRRLCAGTTVTGKRVADAVHAALAIESGCEWVSADSDFARFGASLRWRHL